MRRYVVTRTPDQRAWGILDRYLYGFCALPADGVTSTLPIPLEWSVREAAEAWLYQCRVAWGRNLVPAPEGWNGPVKAGPSPFDRGWRFYN